VSKFIFSYRFNAANTIKKLNKTCMSLPLQKQDEAHASLTGRQASLIAFKKQLYPNENN
jgi:hypothetical protein